MSEPQPFGPGARTDALVEELLQSTGLLLRRLRAEASADELTWSQSAVIGRLSREGQATTADLARTEGVKPQSMGVTLASLEREGLVERAPHPTDGRQLLFRLTSAGEAAREHRQLLKRTWLAGALAELSGEETVALGLAIGVFRRLCAQLGRP